MKLSHTAFALAPILLALAAPVAAQSIDAIQTRAAAGDRASQFLLGEAYRTGQGVTPDRDQAIAWFRKAAAQGDTRAADALGLLLFTKGERKEAIPLLEGAETRQDARALYLLGTARFNGDGVPKDLPRAYAEMRAAADKSLPQAIRSLQLMEPYISAQDRQAAAAIRPGVTPVATASVAPASVAPTAAVPSTAPVATAIARPSPTPIRTTAIPPSVPVEATSPLTPPAPSPAAQTPLAPSPLPAPTATSAAVLAPLTPPAALPAPTPAPIPVAVAKPAPLPAPAPPPRPKPVTPATGKWRVQLGALTTQDKAEDQWRALVKKLPELNRLTHVVVQAGPIWRLQASGLASRDEANDLCKAVVAKNGVCIALNPA
ncbi:sporulation protein [Sphingomonas sp. AP4-R1]|uniref:SPOR domain-containing protein n=1 Tax=Sphingomonas sp. AP4-R1 TaxID=2735134 RepID=UPI001493DC16|nr:SPOR domain-containing protein [Sphingomonas sp. AP4-R1]QJU59820.1 sporulation protein [Sphingomonas sp. AP4-R1]